ncbi:MAG: hypothetical protein V2A79_10225 [Planctomycetota bacterium]
MKQWLATLMLGALRLAGERMVAWWCTEQRGLEARARDRELWWRFKVKAEGTETPADNLIAGYLRARFNFHDSPLEKLHKDMMARTGLGNGRNHP